MKRSGGDGINPQRSPRRYEYEQQHPSSQFRYSRSPSPSPHGSGYSLQHPRQQERRYSSPRYRRPMSLSPNHPSRYGTTDQYFSSQDQIPRSSIRREEYNYRQSPIREHYDDRRPSMDKEEPLHWEGMTEDIDQYVASCQVCQRSGLGRTIKHKPPLHPIPITDVWEQEQYCQIKEGSSVIHHIQEEEEEEEEDIITSCFV